MTRAKRATIARPDEATWSRVKLLLEDGASYSEAARTFNIGVNLIKRRFPQFTLTPEQKAEFSSLSYQWRALEKALPSLYPNSHARNGGPQPKPTNRKATDR